MTDAVQVRNWLNFGGVDLRSLSLIAAEGPFFIYSREKIRDRWGEIKSALPEEVHIAYSLKANPWLPVVQFMSTLAEGLDVTSGSELIAALNTGKPADRIMFAGPGKSERDLTCAIAAGATICVESPLEMTRIRDIAMHIGARADVLVRVNPDFELKKIGMRMGGQSKPFGIDAEECPKLLAEMDTNLLRFRGLHVYWGSQCLDAEVIAKAQRSTFEMILGLSDHFPEEPEILNFGGGFGIPYTSAAKPLDLPVVGERMGEWLPDLTRAFPRAGIFLELGRYLIGEAGLYVCRVVDIKQSRGQQFLVTDGGLHHHLAASGNFGQVIRRNYPIALANRVNQPATAKSNIVGCLCTPLDVLGADVDFPEAEVGDYVAIFQSGAYARTASPTDFLGHPEPHEFLL